MGILSLTETQPTPREVYNWRVYALAAVASFASCTIGYDSAFIGTTLALPSFTSEFHFSKLSKSEKNLVSANIVSVYQAGAFFGAWAGYAGGYFFGRRFGLLMFSLIFVLGSGIMLAASESVGLGPIYGGRVLAGFAVGGASNLVPIYIAELAPPAVRGRLVGIYELGWQIGGLVGFWINYGISETHVQGKAWRIPFAVQLIPGGLLFLGTLWIKESPRWLASKGKSDKALKVLSWVRGLPEDHEYVQQELREIENAVDETRRAIGDGFWAPFKALKHRHVQWRFALGFSLFLWQNASGINAINYYSPTVFKSLGIQGTNTGFLTTGLFGVVKTVMTLLWLFWLIDRFGRRNLLMVGAFGGSVCMWIIGAFVKVSPPTTTTSTKVSSKGVAAIFFFYLWTTFYSPSWNGTPWVLNSEMFDNNTRPLGQASAASSNWFWNFLISRFTPQMFATMGYGVYFFFASLMLSSVVFVYFLIPETKGVPLEKMDRLFAVKPASRAHRIVVAEMKDQAESEEVESQVVEVTRHIDKSMDNAMYC